MPKYYYVVDTSITNDAGVAVGQTTYDLLIDERLSHGVIPETTGPGAGTTWAPTDSAGVQIGIHTTQLVGIGGTAVHDFNLKVHGSASVGLATIGVTTFFGGTYETTRSNDKILSPTNNDVALTVIGGSNNVAIDVSQETVAIGTVGIMHSMILRMFH